MEFVHKNKLWYYCRKALFQIIFPALLSLLTLCDYFFQVDDVPTESYYHLYFYTSSILFCYACIKYTMEFIFDVCSDNIYLKENTKCNIIKLKRIFKLRYSHLRFFKIITQICWYVGMDCPILICSDIIAKLGECESKVNPNVEQSVLDNVLSNLKTYQPVLYEVSPVANKETIETKHVITKLDNYICDLKKEIFNIDHNIDIINIV